MTYWLSTPVEQWLQNHAHNDQPALIDTLIIGSGYGAAMAALALSDAPNGDGSSIVVFERGNEYLPQDFPKTLGELPGFAGTITSQRNTRGDWRNPDGIYEPRGPLNTIGLDALWDIRVGEGVTSVAGSGLGGTSLVNAGVAVKPSDTILQGWPQPQNTDWQTRFEACYDKLYALLGISRHPRAETFNKYQALKQTAKALDPTATVEPAEVAINFGEPGIHSVTHGPCNDCGNCVIGCHSGAKQSLNANAWPLVKQRGGTLCTGATVKTLEQHQQGYTVTGVLTRNSVSEFRVIAKRIIVAAGTIGSTEILTRSTSLSLSARLGDRFSTNGDALVFATGQAQPVNALADVPHSRVKNGAVGPTIIGRATTGLHGDTLAGPVTLEDGAIPWPMASLWHEMLTTQTFFNRFVSSASTAWQQQNNQTDAIIATPELGDHSQVLLTMGLDNASGLLKTTGTDGHIVPTWSEPTRTDGFYGRLDADFQAVPSNGFDGGVYYANPAWRPLPSAFTDVLEGAEDIPGMIVTVHPLGGCVMGHNASEGVVNTRGEVFNTSRIGGEASTVTYPNLYVMDGSIIPGAIGINPMITIAALAYTLATDVARTSVNTAPFEALTPEWKTPPADATVVDHLLNTTDPDNTSVNALFSERLFYTVKNSDTITEINALLQSATGKRLPSDATALVLDINFYFENDHSLDRWIHDPDTDLPATASLGYVTTELVHSSEDTDIQNNQLIDLTGTVNLGVRDSVEGLSQWVRLLKVWWRFIKYRPFDLVAGLTRDDASVDTTHKPKPWLIKRLIRAVKGYIRVGKMHSTHHKLVYTLAANNTNHAADHSASKPLTLSGVKKLAFEASEKTVFDALLELPVTWTLPGKPSVESTFCIDIIRITKGPSPLQITQAPDTPTAISTVASAGLYFGRVIAQTHFWSFGAPTYSRTPWLQSFDRARMNEPPKRMPYYYRGKACHSVSRESFYSDDGLTRLVRYQPSHLPAPDAHQEHPALLLVHGLAHSSEVFWTDTINENYTQYFLSKGYQVWIVDHRVSANTQLTVDPAHTWDQIALEDLVWSVTSVYQTINTARDPATRARQVHVFSHCIGAGAMSMAVLSGKLQQPDNPAESMLASLVPHAVTPWVYASKANRTRENLWAMMKDLDVVDLVEPRLHKETEVFEMMADRVATASIDETERRAWRFLSHAFDKRGPGFARYVYYRYTMFWGQQWNHDNITPKLQKLFASMIGPVPIAVIQQILLSERRQRLVGHEGRNEYVTSAALQRYWTFPTLFVHGRKNTVFDIESSRLSARLLTEHRFYTDQLSDEDTADAMPDNWQTAYADHGVWLDTYDNYGHMDVIFGKTATQDIGPALDRFYQAAHAHAAIEPVLHNSRHSESPIPDIKAHFKQFSAHYRSRSIRHDDDPRSSVDGPKRLMTGPILSHVSNDSIRVWGETEDYATWLATDLRLTQSGNQPVASQQRDVRGHATQSTPAQGRFWLYDLTDPTSIKDTVSVEPWHPLVQSRGAMPRYHLTDEPAVSDASLETAALIRTHRDRTPYNSDTLSLHTMPWFCREFSAKNNALATDRRSTKLSLALGSCLHPGTTFERYNSDRVFQGIQQHVDGTIESGVDLLMLLGDQIYADASANLFDPNPHYERFRERYRMAFNGPFMKQVMASVPTHMVVDDHAIHDNYSGLATINSHDETNPAEDEFDYAQREAWFFQQHAVLMQPDASATHSEVSGEESAVDAVRHTLAPAIAIAPSNALQSADAQVADTHAAVTPVNLHTGSQTLWHQFERLGYPFFCFDTRFERTPLPRDNASALFGQPAQTEAFKRWLMNNRQQRILFIASGSPLAPVSRSLVKHPALYHHNDDMNGYPGALCQLTELVHREAPNAHIVWLSGDPHFSSIAEIHLQCRDRDTTITSITASGLYAPIPFANADPNDYDWGHTQTLSWPDNPLTMTFTQRLLSTRYQQFTRLDIQSDDTLLIRSFDADGVDSDPANPVIVRVPALSENIPA